MTRYRLLETCMATALAASAGGAAAEPAPAGVLFSEGFDDPNVVKRGWYDSVKVRISQEGPRAGKGCIEYEWEEGGKAVGSRGLRHLFKPTEVVYIRFYIKLSKGWGWSGRNYHPHMLHFLTTENPKYHGPARSHLTLYVESNGGKLRLGATDMQNAGARHGLTQGPLRGGYNGKLYDSQEALLTDANWHCVEAMFKLNSVDAENDKWSADGELRGWFDGKLVVERTDVIFRTTDFPKMKFNQFLLAPYFGPGLLPHAQKLWIDELAVGTKRIGPLPASQGGRGSEGDAAGAPGSPGRGGPRDRKPPKAGAATASTRLSARPGPFDGKDFRGRIAWSADGNFNDEDDWAASPVALAILARCGVADRLVHFDYNCILAKTDPNWEREHERSVLGAGVYKVGLHLRASGTPDEPIVLRAAGDGEVVCQGLGPTVRRGPRTNYALLVDGSHWRIHGLVFREWFMAIIGKGADIAVTRCRFLGGRTGISIRGKDWYIADNVFRGFQDPASGAFWPEGVLLRGEGHVLCHNTITRHGDQVSLECRDSDVCGNDIFAASDDGIENDLGGPNLRIWGNRIYSIMHNGVSFQPYLHGPCYLVRNQIAGCGENIFKDRCDSSGLILLHNTLINFTTTSLIRHVYARNNLFAVVPPAGAPASRRPERSRYAMRHRPVDGVNWSMDLDYNGYGGGIAIGPWMEVDRSFQTAAELAKATGSEAHGVSTTIAECFAEPPSIPRPPRVADPAPVFRLKKGSPALDSGVVLANINQGPVGSAPDMGAMEPGAPEPHYGPRPG